jgi:hypothetical protein
MNRNELRRRAMLLLEHPESYPALPSRPSSRLRILIWKYPSFEPFASWALMADKQATFVRRVVWDPTKDNMLEPVTYGAESPIEASVADQVLTELSALTLPLYVQATGIGLDGTRCGVEVGDHMSKARFAWWEEEPLAWEPLRKWHERTLVLLEARLPHRSAQ